MVVVVRPPSTGSGRALRRAQDRLSADADRLFNGFGASGGGTDPGVLKQAGRDSPMGSQAEEGVDRCPLLAAYVSSFGGNVSTFRANVSSLHPNVSSRG